MKKNLFTRFLMLPFIFLEVFAGPGSTAIGASGKATPIPSEHGAPGAKRHNRSFYTSPEALLHKLKQNQPVTIVDIRPVQEFERARIPGSLNIPLYAIRTKTFLASMPFILVDDGYRYRALERECEILWNAGLKASFLTGGLNGWQQRGGPLEEDVFRDKKFNRISPQAFYRGKNDEAWTVMDASSERTAESMELFPDALHIPVTEGAENTPSNVFKKLKYGKLGEFHPLLIFNRDGNQYEKVETCMKRAGVTRAFYLQGGLMSYERFLHHLSLSLKPRDERLRTLNECRTCGKRDFLGEEDRN